MKTYWRTRHLVDFNGFRDERVKEFDYAKKIKDYDAMIKIFPESIEFIENPTEEAQLAAVGWEGHLIKHIENPTEKVQVAAVNTTGDAIKYIKNPTEEAQIAAVSKDGLSIRYIENPTERVQLEAVKNYSQSIKHIKNPSEKVQLVAVYIKPDLYYYLKAKYEISENVEVQAVDGNSDILFDIKNPSERVILSAINNNPGVLYKILGRTKYNPSLKLSDSVIMAAVEGDSLIYDYLKSINYPISDEIKSLAKRKYGYLQ